MSTIAYFNQNSIHHDNLELAKPSKVIHTEQIEGHAKHCALSKHERLKVATIACFQSKSRILQSSVAVHYNSSAKLAARSIEENQRNTVNNLQLCSFTAFSSSGFGHVRGHVSAVVVT